MDQFNNQQQQMGMGGGMPFGMLGGMQPQGFNYVQNPNPPKYTQPLTPEEMAMLRKNTEQFSLGLTQEESLRAICFHRDENGNETLRANPDGTYTCTICGHTFMPTNIATPDDVRDTIANTLDIIQTIKLLYLDMPAEAAREYFQIIPLIEKLPKLFEIASKDFSKHENWNNQRFNGGVNTVNMYNMLAGGFNNPMMQTYQPQPQMQMQAAPMGVQSPMMGGSNGFGFMGGMPQQSYQPQPQQNPYSYVPNQTQAAPQVTPASATETPSEGVKVDTAFKA